MVEDRASPAEVALIGCCGAYCKTCRPFQERTCKGCKVGYDTDSRDISRARCPMKVCCVGSKHLRTCADCLEASVCPILQGFFAKNGYKYTRYRKSLSFIRIKGYGPFLKQAKTWTGAYGCLEDSIDAGEGI